MATLRKREWYDAEKMLASFRARIIETKAIYTSHLREEIADHPMGLASLGVKAAKGIRLFRLLYYIDWEKCPTPASLWTFCGYAVVEGKSQYKARITWSARTTWSTGASAAVASMKPQILRNTQYRAVMESRYNYERSVNFLPERISKKRAQRYTTKLYLRHLWVTGRSVYGLPLGEQHPSTPYPDPTEFGWDMTIRI